MSPIISRYKIDANFLYLNHQKMIANLWEIPAKQTAHFNSLLICLLKLLGLRMVTGMNNDICAYSCWDLKMAIGIFFQPAHLPLPLSHSPHSGRCPKTAVSSSSLFGDLGSCFDYLC